MTKEYFNDLEKKYFKVGLLKAGLLLLNHINSLNFIKECKDLGYSLYGIDGFFVGEDYIRPSLENSIVFDTNKSIKKDVYKQAVSFINSKLNLDLMFEIVCSKEVE